jgi:putative endonuclease
MKLDKKHIETGMVGEEIASNFLISKRFFIVDRNFRTRFGEIDIIAKRDSIFHFVEVKTVSCEPNQLDSFQPEENVTASKLDKLQKTIEIYLGKK